MKKACLIIISVLMTANAAQAASYYKWVDENGLTHFSATPPVGIPSIQIEKGMARPASGSGGSPLPAPGLAEPDSDETSTEKQAEQEGFQDQLAEADETRQKNCETAKQNKIQLTLKNRIRLLQEDGSYRVLSDAEKQQELRQADEAIDTYCN
ncbi:DUF4124 domain-containing protein [Aestuariirhabdus litorea]|uniref:DUF4124 domain-containing protein n=1 Tax=Aestuariirhabdus litorea TaxID=2528527 RepID=A0A3P3VK25_9GAMM|nr:DUF4124 domain-containing protein [Aestuariirhabdus litorea]RRJ82238.1 DUF4124 domain-containing protein [Aestuariirhabdus litorea]RWW92406.1 DUF4124 domain-containing protein [Endozoicomonadaceae bacterium GTF-13]